MTPGLAFFYGGLVRASSVVSMMMMSIGSLGLIAVLWIVFGYAISFGNAGHGNFIGIDGFVGIDINKIFLADIVSEAKSGDAFGLAFAGFQGTFAIITVALISGAIADRARFGSWMIFAAIWATLVYFPVANWVFNFAVDNGKVVDGGWLVYNIGLLDFAGGTVVEVASGASALALALVVGKRFGFTKGMHAPHNVPLTLIGVGILWFGWFGFNPGSTLGAVGKWDLIGSVATNTFLASAAGGIATMLYTYLRYKKVDITMVINGVLAGLVAITAGCNVVSADSALIIGFIAGTIVDIAVVVVDKIKVDDPVGAVAVHGVNGFFGTIAVGLFSQKNGLFITGESAQFITQLIGVSVISIFSFATTYALFMILKKTMGIRLSHKAESAGIDAVEFGVEAYTTFE